MMSGTPSLAIELEPGPPVSDGSDCHVTITLRRLRDGFDQRCVVHWSAYADGFRPNHFDLLRWTEQGFSKCDVGDGSSTNTETRLLVNGWNQSLWELGPGDKVCMLGTLPKRYRKQLAKGRDYELVWSGADVSTWDWGTIKQHLGQELGPKFPKISIPGGARIPLRVVDAEDPRNSPPPVGPGEVISGAPKLRVDLDCNPEVPKDATTHIRVRVLYEAAPDSLPITFHTHVFESAYGPREGYRLYRRHEDAWKTCTDQAEGGFMIVDDPDVAVNVGQGETFASLRPGQVWTTSRTLHGKGSAILADSTVAGEVFRYVFKGANVDWWDWGSKEDHAQTIVKLPCYVKGPVVDPPDNGGRPRLVVPVSNTVEFTIV